MAPQPKLPPHSIEAEQSVLGGLMLNNRLIDEVADKINASDFYRRDHQLIFEQAAAMLGARKACDYVTLSEHLRQLNLLEEAGGSSYLASLAVDTYSVANVVAYAEIVRERAVLRRLITIGNEIGDMGYRPDGRTPDQLIEVAERAVFDLRVTRRRADGLRPMREYVVEAEALIESTHKSGRKLGGVSTGFRALDNRIDGLHGGDLVIVAARPKMGKTALAFCIAENVATITGKRVAAFSMEMQGRQIALRVLSRASKVALTRLRGGTMDQGDWDKLTSASASARSELVLVDQTPALSPTTLRARARRAATGGGLALIVVDYLQLMRVPGHRENKTNEVGDIAESLKGLAKELDVPVIALSQLSRAGEKEGRRPKASDLRDSGGIEQAADVVMFVHREPKAEGAGYADGVGAAEIIVDMQRQGEPGTERLNFFGACCRFEDMSSQDELDFEAERQQSKLSVRPERGFGRIGKVAAAGE